MGVPEKIDPEASWRKIFGPAGNVDRICPGWSGSGCPRRRRRGENVGIARLCFWRDFQARWEAWKSPKDSFLSAAGCRPDFCTLSRARHFHRDTPPLCSSGHSRGAPETAEVLVAGTKESRESFSQEVKS